MIDGAAERGTTLRADGAFSAALQHGALIAVMALLLACGRRTRPLPLWPWRPLGRAGFLQLPMLILRQYGGNLWHLCVSFDREMRRFFREALPGMVAIPAQHSVFVGAAIVASRQLGCPTSRGCTSPIA